MATQKTLKLVLSQRAAKDLNEIYHYLANHSLDALQKVDQKIFAALRRLTKFPNSGHWVKEFATKKYREINVYHYRIIYHYTQKPHRIVVLTIRHGKRFFPKNL